MTLWRNNGSSLSKITILRSLINWIKTLKSVFNSHDKIRNTTYLCAVSELARSIREFVRSTVERCDARAPSPAPSFSLPCDEWLLCIVHRSLKSAVVREKPEKKWLKVENILKEAAFQHRVSATLLRTRWTRIGHLTFSSFLTGGQRCRYCLSVRHQWIFPMKRGEILHRSGLSDFTVGPFRVQIRPALWMCWCVLSNK